MTAKIRSNKVFPIASGPRRGRRTDTTRRPPVGRECGSMQTPGAPAHPHLRQARRPHLPRRLPAPRFVRVRGDGCTVDVVEAVVGAWYVADRRAGALKWTVPSGGWHAVHEPRRPGKTPYSDRCAELDGVKAFAFFRSQFGKATLLHPAWSPRCASIQRRQGRSGRGNAFAVQPDGSYLGVAPTRSKTTFCTSAS
jgi:hypothetical protein